MLTQRANPAWPAEIIKLFDATMTETPMGCGNCGNAEWVSDTDNHGHLFVVSICSAGIPFKDGTPKEYCTHFQRSSKTAMDQKTPAPSKGTTRSALTHQK